MKNCDSRKKECVFVCRLRQIKNHTLLLLGFTLENAHGYHVKLNEIGQIWDNNNRTIPYSLDDKDWKISEMNVINLSVRCIVYHKTHNLEVLSKLYPELV